MVGRSRDLGEEEDDELKKCGRDRREDEDDGDDEDADADEDHDGSKPSGDPTQQDPLRRSTHKRKPSRKIEDILSGRAVASL